MPSNVLFTVSILVALLAFIQYQDQKNRHDLCTLWQVTHDETKDLYSHKLSQYILSSPIDSSYNIEDSTSNHYASSTNNNHVSKYRKIRNSNKIDMKYHNYYTRQRIKLQDKIIDLFLNNPCNHKCIKNEDRWIIFFGGAPGAGKSYLIKHLSSIYIPELHRNNSIVINADFIRPLLPEYGLYENDRNKQISLLSTEVGLICELMLWVSLERNKDKHIVFDSSMRHTPWFKWLFNTIVNEYKQYKIAMIGVLSVNMKQLKTQILKRNEYENRITEWEFVKQVVVDVNRSLFELKYLVNIAINITNPGIPFEEQNKNQFKICIFCGKSQMELYTDLGQSNATDLLAEC
eukprot:532003_1